MYLGVSDAFCLTVKYFYFWHTFKFWLIKYKCNESLCLYNNWSFVPIFSKIYRALMRWTPWNFCGEVVVMSPHDGGTHPQNYPPEIMQPSSSTRATIVRAENQNGGTIVKATFFFCHHYIVWESNNAGEAWGQSWNEEAFCCAFFAAAMLTMVAAATIVRFPPVIHHKISILWCVKNLTTYDILDLWHLTS